MLEHVPEYKKYKKSQSGNIAKSELSGRVDFFCPACLSKVGSFFMINLCLVVIATQFSETKQREHQLMQEQRARCSSSSTLASEPGDCYEELFQLLCHVIRKARRQTLALFNALRGKPRGFRGVGRGRRAADARERKANGRGGRDGPALLPPGQCHNMAPSLITMPNFKKKKNALIESKHLGF